MAVTVYLSVIVNVKKKQLRDQNQCFPTKENSNHMFNKVTISPFNVMWWIFLVWYIQFHCKSSE